MAAIDVSVFLALIIFGHGTLSWIFLNSHLNNISTLLITVNLILLRVQISYFRYFKILGIYFSKWVTYN